MYQINNYLLNVFVSVGLLEAFTEIANIQLLTNIIDLVIMLVLVAVSRLITVPIEKLYKKLLSKILKTKENE